MAFRIIDFVGVIYLINIVLAFKISDLLLFYQIITSISLKCKDIR